MELIKSYNLILDEKEIIKMNKILDSWAHETEIDDAVEEDMLIEFAFEIINAIEDK